MVHDWCQPSLEASVRCDGLEHAAACAKCGDLLASVHSLGVGLWALAEASGSIQAPPSVEKALLEAFRREWRPVRAASTPPRWEVARWAMSRWVLAVGAASALGIVTLGFLSWRTHQPFLGGGNGQPPIVSASRNESGTRAVAPSATSDPGSLAATAERRLHPAPGALVAQGAPPREANELATDFLPLGGVLDPSDLEQAEVVRVSLPGSALADLGLLLNEDAEATTITAEVLIAEDGTARGIRFVR
jgi:hypothetical protein